MADVEVAEEVKKAYGVLGFVKFLKGYYMMLITQKKKKAKIGKHSIYKVQEVKMVKLFKEVITDNRDEEEKFKN